MIKIDNHQVMHAQRRGFKGLRTTLNTKLNSGKSEISSLTETDTRFNSQSIIIGFLRSQNTTMSIIPESE